MNKTFKYRIYCNKQIYIKTSQWIENCRILYNLCLEQRIINWKRFKKSYNKYDQIYELPAFKKAFPEFAEPTSEVTEDVCKRIHKAYQGFFRRIKAGQKAGFPRFKAKNSYDSFTLRRCGYKLIGQYLYITRLGKFKIKLSRPIEGKIKAVIIKKTLTNKLFVSFVCENIPIKPLPKTNKSIGIDMGCLSFLTDSNGNKVNNPRFFKKIQNKLANYQQILSRKKRGSNRRKKAKLNVAKIYEKIFNQRKDFHYKTANKLLKENDIICIEKLKSWNSFRSLNRSMRDVAWFQFFDILKCKAEEANRQIIEVNPKYTSQICSRCNKIVKKTLADRIHSCSCGLSIDRDYNSAINILARAEQTDIASPKIRKLSL